MHKENEFDVEIELIGEKIIFLSFVKNGRNYFRDFLENLDENGRKKIVPRISKIANDYGLNLRNQEILKWITKKKIKFGYIKTKNPSLRVSIWRYDFIKTFAIIILGFSKKSEKADKKTSQFYDKTINEIKFILENEDEFKKKLGRILKRIQK